MRHLLGASFLVAVSLQGEPPVARQSPQYGTTPESAPTLECPMPVLTARPLDQMPVARPSPRIRYDMPVVPSNCVNPLGPVQYAATRPDSSRIPPLWEKPSIPRLLPEPPDSSKTGSR